MTLQDNAVGRPNERTYQVDCVLLNRQYKYFPTASERNIKNIINEKCINSYIIINESLGKKHS
jgi:hypothetical protein